MYRRSASAAAHQQKLPTNEMPYVISDRLPTKVVLITEERRTPWGQLISITQKVQI
jgi:hypothetical protein